jgi:putative ABC transport system substrate-binding protein
MQLCRFTRRDFVALLGGGAATWPIAARAQQDGRTRRIGVLQPYSEQDTEAQLRFKAFERRLQELGWVSGRNVRMVTRWSTPDVKQLKVNAAELVAMQPDVILAASTPAVSALQQTTRSVPVVFTNVIDPVGSGFVATLAHPGANITGFTTFEAPIAGKWLQLLKEIAPRTTRVALLFNPLVNPGMAPGGIVARAFEAVSPSFDGTIVQLPVHNDREIESGLVEFARVQNSGLIVVPEPFTTDHHGFIAAVALRERLPGIFPYRFFVTRGGLLSYGIDLTGQFRDAASYVSRILHGETPQRLPVQLPAKFQFVINLKTANAIEIAVPPIMFARADEVIE